MVDFGITDISSSSSANTDCVVIRQHSAVQLSLITLMLFEQCPSCNNVCLLRSKRCK
jgi:hypothetical protein